MNSTPRPTTQQEEPSPKQLRELKVAGAAMICGGLVFGLSDVAIRLHDFSQISPLGWAAITVTVATAVATFIAVELVPSAFRTRAALAGYACMAVCVVSALAFVGGRATHHLIVLATASCSVIVGEVLRRRHELSKL